MLIFLHLQFGLIVQVASVLSMVALVYMRIFLKDSVPGGALRQPLLKEVEEPCDEDDSSPRATGTFKKLPSLGDLICLLRCRYVWHCINWYYYIDWTGCVNYCKLPNTVFNFHKSKKSPRPPS